MSSTLITEIVVKMQMIDVILPLGVLRKYAGLVKSFGQLMSVVSKTDGSVDRKKSTASITSVTNFSNDSFPLLFLEFKGLRLMLPASTATEYNLQHDLLTLQVAIQISRIIIEFADI